MKQINSQLVQAFPATANTFVGTASNLDTTNYVVVHAAVDGTLTFDFGTDVVTLDVTAGQDIAIGNGCKTLTSSATVWVS